MFYYLYEIRNNLNGKIYVGVHKTKSLDDGYMGSGKVIRSAITKHGIENFTKVVLETFENAEAMYAREKEVVTDEFLLREDTYNLRRGGLGGWAYLNNNSELQRDKGIRANRRMKYLRCIDEQWTQNISKKISETNKKQYRDGIRIPIGFSDSFRKATQSEEVKVKRKETQIKIKFQQGENNSNFGRIWIKNKSLKCSFPVKKEELGNYLDHGWEIGRCFSWERIEKSENDKKQKEIEKQQKFKEKMEMILSSSVDVTVKGWPVLMAAELGVSRNHVKGFIKRYIPELWKKCLIETSKIRYNN